mgnify:CR=1 FL=1
MKKSFILSILCILVFALVANANSINKDYDLNDIKKSAKTVSLKDDDTQINYYGIDKNKDGKIDTIFIERINEKGNEVIKYIDNDYDGWVDELLFDRTNGADGIFETTTDLPSKGFKISNVFPEQS